MNYMQLLHSLNYRAQQLLAIESRFGTIPTQIGVQLDQLSDALITQLTQHFGINNL